MALCKTEPLGGVAFPSVVICWGSEPLGLYIIGTVQAREWISSRTLLSGIRLFTVSTGARTALKRTAHQRLGQQVKVF